MSKDFAIKADQGSFNKLVITTPKMDNVNIEYNKMNIYKEGAKISEVPLYRIGDNAFKMHFIVNDKFSAGEYIGEIKGNANGESITKKVIIEVEESEVVDKFSTDIDKSLPLEMQDWK